MADVISFQISEEPPARLTPVINGRPLTDLIAEFELSRGDQTASGYGGLVPDYFNFGDLRDYLHGRGERQCPRPGATWLLGCRCGEVGCLALEATVDAGPTLVVWSGFTQPDRPDGDYAGFGPFMFDPDQYETAIDEAVECLGRREPEW